MKTPFSSLAPQIAIQAVRSLLNYAEQLGLDRNGMLSHINLTQEQLNDSRLLFDVMRYEALFQLISEKTDNEMLGFQFGQRFEPDRWGVLGYIALTSQNILAVMEAQYRFQSLTGNMGTPISHTQGGLVTLQWIPAFNCSHHLCEQIVTGLVSLARNLSNRESHSPDKVCFTHSNRGNSAEYEAYFNCSVIFGADYNGVVLPVEMLQTPLRKADPELNKVLVTHAESMLALQSFNSPLEVIKDFVIKTLPSHAPNIEEVSIHLGMSVRSTQRKLQDFGTSYSRVLDGIRQELAMTYLRQTNNSALYVSDRLGFSEQTAFQRAFKRWTGTTPRKYRGTEIKKS